MSDDIKSVLEDWDKNPNFDKIRKIDGLDGKEKIQIRVKFGMLQLEADGRPDGKRPYGRESMLDHYLALLGTYKRDFETDEGFKLDHHDCERLREESIQYYHRYVSLFDLEDYQRAERDTDRNLRVSNMMKKYAEQKDDALSFEKYRPYILMMNARAKAFICMSANDNFKAIARLEEAIKSITDFYIKNGFDDSQIGESQELAVLKATAKEIRDKWEGE